MFESENTRTGAQTDGQRLNRYTISTPMTNGPVKAYLISGSSISTKHTKPGKYKVKK